MHVLASFVILSMVGYASSPQRLSLVFDANQVSHNNLEEPQRIADHAHRKGGHGRRGNNRESRISKSG